MRVASVSAPSRIYSQPLRNKTQGNVAFKQNLGKLLGEVGLDATDRFKILWKYINENKYDSIADLEASWVMADVINDSKALKIAKEIIKNSSPSQKVAANFLSQFIDAT